MYSIDSLTLLETCIIYWSWINLIWGFIMSIGIYKIVEYGIVFRDGYRISDYHQFWFIAIFNIATIATLLFPTLTYAHGAGIVECVFYSLYLSYFSVGIVKWVVSYHNWRKYTISLTH